MGRFVDLYLNNPSEETIRFAKILGYGMVGVVTDISQPFHKLDTTNLKVEVVGRVNLEPSSTQSLLQKLRVLRRKFELIAVICKSRSIARLAARDRRVDLLMFPPKTLGLFDEVEAKFASKAGVALEINFNFLLNVEENFRVKVFSELERILVLVRKHGVPLVISSGATDVYGLRAPRDLAAFFQMFGLSKREVLDAVSTTPKEIVERNREKLSKDFVGVGVRLVREKVDW
ncbi:hypothetical protein DRO26_01075 [Candidatus Bathyarchaeota archaeon]|nr:MAG: hypothetical protein DRO26_01075 [Candidatus Bathyarchaeota archaeon]